MLTLNISKKKKNEFGEIFKLFENNNFYIDIELLKKMFDSDFFEQFLLYLDDKIKNLLKNFDIIIFHLDINKIHITDTYYYDKIVKLSKLLHNFSNNIKQIIIYGNSSLFGNFIKIIEMTLKINIHDKIVFNKKDFNSHKIKNI